MSDLEIWLVNDDPAQLLVQKRLLGRFAATVWDFQSPAELVSQAKRFGSCPNLVSDYHMPGMNGFELSQLWCEMHPNAKILLLSASHLSANEREQTAFLPSNRVRLLTDFRIPELMKVAQTWFTDAEGEELSSSESSSETAPSLQFFDNEVHAKLRQLGGEEFLQKALKRFGDKTPERMQNLHLASQNDDLEKVHRESHSLKGSCGIVGASSLLDRANKLELLAQSDPDHSHIEKALIELESTWNQTQEELKSLLTTGE